MKPPCAAFLLFGAHSGVQSIRPEDLWLDV